MTGYAKESVHEMIKAMVRSAGGSIVLTPLDFAGSGELQWINRDDGCVEFTIEYPTEKKSEVHVFVPGGKDGTCRQCAHFKSYPTHHDMHDFVPDPIMVECSRCGMLSDHHIHELPF